MDKKRYTYSVVLSVLHELRREAENCKFLEIETIKGLIFLIEYLIEKGGDEGCQMYSNS